MGENEVRATQAPPSESGSSTPTKLEDAMAALAGIGPSVAMTRPATSEMVTRNRAEDPVCQTRGFAVTGTIETEAD